MITFSSTFFLRESSLQSWKEGKAHGGAGTAEGNPSGYRRAGKGSRPSLPAGSPLHPGPGRSAGSARDPGRSAPEAPEEPAVGATAGTPRGSVGEPQALLTQASSAPALCHCGAARPPTRILPLMPPGRLPGTDPARSWRRRTTSQLALGPRAPASAGSTRGLCSLRPLKHSRASWWARGLGIRRPMVGAQFPFLAPEDLPCGWSS